MGSSDKRIQISTTLDREVREQAKLNKICLATALEIGVHSMMGSKMELQRLKKEKETVKNHLTSLELSIKDIERRQDKQGKTDKLIIGHIALMKRHSQLLLGGSKPKYLARAFNDATHLSFTPNEYVEIIQRYQNGDFRNNGSCKQ